jgi:hypothetical protein
MRYNTSLFQANRDKKTLSVDVSQLAPATRDPFERLYRDTYDRGFILTGKSGREASFYISRVIRSLDADAEILCWNMKPTMETLRAMPELAGWTITVYND